MSNQLELFDIPSPCIGICQSDARGYCLGCFRSRDERFRWLGMSDEEKREVLRLCRDRARRKRRATAESASLPPTQLTLDGLDEP